MIYLNRYLKSLRNERKKDRKSSAKRAREKDRCRKTKREYLALDWGRETSLKSHLKSLRESPGVYVHVCVRVCV